MKNFNIIQRNKNSFIKKKLQETNLKNNNISNTNNYNIFYSNRLNKTVIGLASFLIHIDYPT